MPAISYGQDYNQRQNSLLSGRQSMGSVQPLPPSGIVRQAQTMNSMLAGSGQQQPQMPSTQPGAPQQQQGQFRADKRAGTTNLNDLATTLAEQYGLPIGRTPLVDQSGNLTRMPSNIDEAVKMQFISQAIADEQNQRAQNRAVASLQTGFGQMQKRAPGSLAAATSGQYGQLADVYMREQNVAQDFSFYIQNEMLKRQEALQRAAEKKAKKGKRGALIGGIIGAAAGTFLMPGLGTAAGASIGAGLGGAAGEGGLF